MRQITTKQISKLETTTIDIGIFSTGYEKRCTYIATSIADKIPIKSKICLSFPNHDFQSTINSKIFSKLGFEILIGSGDDGRWIEDKLKNYLSDNLLEAAELNILVDYSSMTRVWYASILRFFYYVKLNVPKINLIFCYSFSEYSAPPSETIRNIHVEPLDGYSSFSLPDKPTALILGLGYEPEKAFGLTEFFDADTYLFFNDSSLSAKFSKAVEEINNYIINSVPVENVFKYPIGDLVFTEKMLSDLCRALGENHRIVIAPTGPKPFTLLSLIISLKFSDVDVWRISPGSNAMPIDRKASGINSYFQVTIS